MKRTICALSVIGLMAAAGEARADVVLTGPDANAGSYSTSALAGVANGGDTVSSGGLTGVTLWGLLGGANSATAFTPTYGAITTSTPNGANNKNAILRYYLLGTNAGGQRSVVSLGEIDPNFGGTAAVAPFVAFQNGGGLLAAPQLVVPGTTGRDLVNLTSLQLLAVPAISGPGGPSTAVQLTGNVAHPGSYTKADLQNDFTPVTSTISGDTYTGSRFGRSWMPPTRRLLTRLSLHRVPMATRSSCRWRNSTRRWVETPMTCCPTPTPARIFRGAPWLGQSFPMTTSTGGGNRIWISSRLQACLNLLRWGCSGSP